MDKGDSLKEKTKRSICSTDADDGIGEGNVIDYILSRWFHGLTWNDIVAAHRLYWAHLVEPCALESRPPGSSRNIEYIYALKVIYPDPF